MNLLRSRGKDFEYEVVFPQSNMKGVVESLFNENRIGSEHGARLDFFELEPLVLKLDGEIVAYLAHALDGEDGIQVFFLVFRERSVQIAFFCGDHLELCIELRDKRFKKYIGFGNGRDVRETQLFH